MQDVCMSEKHTHIEQKERAAGVCVRCVCLRKARLQGKAKVQEEGEGSVRGREIVSFAQECVRENDTMGRIVMKGRRKKQNP